METKIQQLAFMGSRKKYICEYLEKYPEILSKTVARKEEEKKIEVILTDVKEVRGMIENAVEFLDMTYNYTSQEKITILGKITKEVIGIFNEKTLTKKILNEIIEKQIEV